MKCTLPYTHMMQVITVTRIDCPGHSAQFAQEDALALFPAVRVEIFVLDWPHCPFFQRRQQQQPYHFRSLSLFLAVSVVETHCLLNSLSLSFLLR